MVFIALSSELSTYGNCFKGFINKHVGITEKQCLRFEFVPMATLW